jgi:XisH protein
MAKDIYHEHVKVALVKEGWTITAEQFSIPAGTRRVRIDLAAEKMILAERGTALQWKSKVFLMIPL